jgi:hypothetical protein
MSINGKNKLCIKEKDIGMKNHVCRCRPATKLGAVLVP